YALGAVLYELLTGRPAVTGEDRQELLRQIAFEEPVAPRKLAPAIPADLETVLLKALAKEPAERYASAQELADDLRHFLEHRPVQARRPTARQRTQKWIRRHPDLAGTLAAALLLLAAVAAVAAALI